MKCPSCGADIQIPEGKSLFFCTFCGTQIHVEDGTIHVEITKNVNIENRYVNAARMRELELQEQERLRIEQQQLEEKKLAAEREEAEKNKEKAKKRKWIKACAIWAGGMIFFLVIIKCFKSFIATKLKQPLISILGILAVLLISFPCILGAKMPDNFFKPGEYPPEGKRIACGCILGVGFVALLNWILSYVIVN